MKNAILEYICISSGQLASRESVVLITVRSCVRDSYGPDFAFCLDYFVFLSSMRIFIA